MALALLCILLGIIAQVHLVESNFMNCSSTSLCKTNHGKSVCFEGKCRCKLGFYLAGDNKCQKKTCIDRSKIKDCNIFPHTKCTNFKCVCKNGFRLNKKSQICESFAKAAMSLDAKTLGMIAGGVCVVCIIGALVYFRCIRTPAPTTSRVIFTAPTVPAATGQQPMPAYIAPTAPPQAGFNLPPPRQPVVGFKYAN